ncbi:MAG: alpha/beta hydrolase [Ahrensia sp.]|nr:alpha/beta hydrolase [Ahrensia sp.]
MCAGCGLWQRCGGSPGCVSVSAFLTAHAGPCLCWCSLRGGYWRVAGPNLIHSFIAPPFTQAGFCVVVVNYALCPGTPEAPVTIPHILRQMEKALGWVWHHVAAHGGDPKRITVAGHSAGGHLAAMLLTSVWSLIGKGLPDGLVRNALSISGLHDLDPIMYTPMFQSVLHLTEQQVLSTKPGPPAGAPHRYALLRLW